MKKVFLIFAKHNQEANKTIAGIMEKLTNDEREKDRKSYYKSLSGLFCHNSGATVYFLNLMKDAAGDNAAVQKALKPLAKYQDFKGKLTEEQWKQALSFSAAADKAMVDFVNALEDKDFEAPVKTDWYKGKPATTPLHFMMEQLISHNMHHRGQISQILDSLKIENDYSGINVKFL
jgi:uncharacterized damage-inducible protein DinB